MKTKKDRARKLVADAVRKGDIVKQPCEVCGSTVRVHAHHNNYNKPLDVKWLCFAHHIEAHGGTVQPDKWKPVRPEVQCVRCDYKWTPHVDEIRACPSCKSPRWNSLVGAVTQRRLDEKAKA